MIKCEIEQMYNGKRIKEMITYVFNLYCTGCPVPLQFSSCIAGYIVTVCPLYHVTESNYFSIPADKPPAVKFYELALPHMAKYDQ